MAAKATIRNRDRDRGTLAGKKSEFPIEPEIEAPEKSEYNQHVGIYEGNVPLELCNIFAKNWEEAKKNQTIIDLSKENQTGLQGNEFGPLLKKDDSAFIGPLFSTIYPKPPVMEYFHCVKKCLHHYMGRYGIGFEGILYNDVFKIHKVKKSEGYHVWHYENASCEYQNRIIVYMTYLEVPKEGGETEFLEQKLRIKPKVGTTLLWPAGYTHMHRGLPPLDGEKLYIDGWFSTSKLPSYPGRNHQHIQ